MTPRTIWLLISLTNTIIWSSITQLIFNNTIATIIVSIVVFIFTLTTGAMCLAAGESDRNL